MNANGREWEHLRSAASAAHIRRIQRCAVSPCPARVLTALAALVLAVQSPARVTAAPPPAAGPNAGQPWQRGDLAGLYHFPFAGTRGFTLGLAPSGWFYFESAS